MKTLVKLVGGASRTALMVDPTTPPGRVRRQLGLRPGKGLVVVNGGTADLSDAEIRYLKPVLDGVIGVVAEDGLTLLTGATDAGLFRVLGDVSESHPGRGRMIGVAPSKLVLMNGDQAAPDDERARLEPHHTDFVLVDTARWGGETGVMLGLAREVARHEPSVAVLASGGDISRVELLGHVRDDRPIIVLAGSGRLADDVADAQKAHGSDSDPTLNEIVHRGRLTVVDIRRSDAPAKAAAAVRDLLEQGRSRRGRQWPVLLRRMPKLRWRDADASRQLVPLEEQGRYPALAADFAYLNDHLLDAYRLCDNEALRQQNYFYLANLVAIVGSLAATLLGIVQAAGTPGAFWFGLAETVLAAALGGGLLIATARTAHRGYYTSRLKAERLRSEYFLFLARHAPYAEEATRNPTLVQRVMEIQTITMAGPKN
jgi:hypothetical protein